MLVTFHFVKWFNRWGCNSISQVNILLQNPEKNYFVQTFFTVLTIAMQLVMSVQMGSTQQTTLSRIKLMNFRACPGGNYKHELIQRNFQQMPTLIKLLRLRVVS